MLLYFYARLGMRLLPALVMVAEQVKAPGHYAGLNG